MCEWQVKLCNPSLTRVNLRTLEMGVALFIMCYKLMSCLLDFNVFFHWHLSCVKSMQLVGCKSSCITAPLSAEWWAALLTSNSLASLEWILLVGLQPTGMQQCLQQLLQQRQSTLLSWFVLYPEKYASYKSTSFVGYCTVVSAFILLVVWNVAWGHCKIRLQPQTAVLLQRAAMLALQALY